MNWFEDLFGSIENPTFQQPLTYHHRMIAYGGQEKYSPENLCDEGWINRQPQKYPKNPKKVKLSTCII